MKMKKLLAAALAATMMLSSMVSAFVASAAETVGSITVGTTEVELGAETANVDVTINFTKEGGVTAPHDLFTLTAPEGFTITDATATYEGTAQEGSKGVYIDPDGEDFASGKILLEAPVDEMAPTVTKIVVAVTYAIADTVVAGTYDITVDSEIADITETDLVLEEDDGAIVVKEVHVCTPAEAVKENEVPATCYAEGSYDSVVYCSDEGCKKELSRTPVTVEKIAHTPAEAVVENNVDATCYAEGSYDSVVYCSVPECKAEISRTPVTVDKTEHTPAEAVVENNVDATCYAEGSYDSVVYCAVAECKHEISRTPVTVEKIAHTPAAPVEENRVEAKPGIAGSYDSVVYCSVPECKAEISRTTNEIPALPTGPVIDSAITIKPYIYYGSEIGVMFQLTKTQLDKYATYELVIDRETYDSKYMLTNAPSDVIPKAKILNNTKRNPYYIIKGIGMYELGLTVSAYINCYDANGDLVAKSNVWSDSVATVIKQAYTTASDLYKTLIADTLNMSAAAQKYFGELPANVNSDLAKASLVNADDPTYDFVASDYASKTTGELNAVENPISYNPDSPISTSAHYLMNSLIFGKSIGVTYLLRDSNSALDLSKLEISVSYTSLYPAGEVTPTTERPLIVNRAGKWIQVSFEGVYLYDTNKVVTATIKYDGKEVLTTNYTVDTYCKAQLASTDANTAALADATAKFGNSARAYFSNQTGYQV